MYCLSPCFFTKKTFFGGVGGAKTTTFWSHEGEFYVDFVAPHFLHVGVPTFEAMYSCSSQCADFPNEIEPMSDSTSDILRMRR